MKRFVVFLLIMVIALCVAAQRRTIVIRGSGSTSTGNTEVFNDSPDTVVVVPGDNVYDVEIDVKSFDGNVVTQYVFPVSKIEDVTISTPDFQDGNVIEIKDETGVIYEIDEWCFTERAFLKNSMLYNIHWLVEIMRWKLIVVI